MADVAVLVFRAIVGIRNLVGGIKENDRQAHRLLERVLAIQPTLVAVHEGTSLSASEPLRELLATLEKIRDFLEEFSQTTAFNRALRRRGNADRFAQLGAMLTEGVHALQLDVAVDTWAKEDALDRLEDLENMVDMMERMERSRLDNHAEVMGVLKALRNDERVEPTGWVEVDYGADLDFQGSDILGSGAFGEVRTAKWNGTGVAVKHLLVRGLHNDTVRALRKEIRLHSSLHFDHVVQLYAACTVPPHLCLVIELAVGGSLWDYLHSAGELQPPPPLPHALQAAFLYDIARGMSFLHTKGILHRDLKSANVLVFADRRLKLCDFGLSKIKTESSSRSKRGAVGTAQWMSPEEMDESPANELTDVYSFGVVCFEVATRTVPFRGLKQTQVTRAVADKGKRPQIPEEASASPDVVPLMEHCWMQDPADRPAGFEPVVLALERVIRRIGDPRDPGAVAVDVTSPSKANRGGTAPSGESRRADASSDGPSPASQTAAAVDTRDVSPEKSDEPAPAESGSVGDRGNPRHAVEETVAQAAVDARGASPKKSDELATTESGSVGNWSTSKSSVPRRVVKETRAQAAVDSSYSSLEKSDEYALAERVSAGGGLAPEGGVRRSAEVEETAAHVAVGARDVPSEKSQEPAPAESGSVGERSAPEGDVPRRAAVKGAVTEGPEKMTAPFANPPTVSRGLPPPNGARSGRFKKLTKMLGRKPRVKSKQEEEERRHEPSTCVLDADGLKIATDLRGQADILTEQGKYAEAASHYLRAIEIQERVLGPDHEELSKTLNNWARLLKAQDKYDLWSMTT